MVEFVLVWLFGWSVCMILLVVAINYLRGEKSDRLKVELAERHFVRIALTMFWQWPFVVLSTIAHVLEDIARGTDDE